jgi:hypothetical protein
MNNFKKYFSKKPTFNDWKSNLAFIYFAMENENFIFLLNYF